MTIAIVSDIHANDWSQYSKTDHEGVNTRLRSTLDELARAATEVQNAGGKDLIICGDIFHVRGSIDPEVLNPVQETVRGILESGVNIHAIPGNHDLKSKETTQLGSAIQTLSETFSMNAVFKVYNEPKIEIIAGKLFAFVPWFSTTDGLLKALDDIKLKCGASVQGAHVVMHAGIDGVVSGMPDHGLTAKILAAYGFNSIYSGHYHNRKNLGDGIWSVGATTHQSWRDVGTKAGFMLLHDDGSISEFDTRAPKFLDLTGYSQDDMELAAPGNFVRFRGPPMTQKEIQEAREFFMNAGALGVSIEAPVAITSTRAAVRPASGTAVSVDQSVLNFADKMTLQTGIDRDMVKREAADVLASIRAVSAA